MAVQLEQGKKVERWTIEKKLGEGAFGAVYNVSDKTGTYALKVEGVKKTIQLLKMEVFLLNELSKAGGRHFCKIEDKGRVDNFYYVVMTFVGKSLQDLRLAAPGKKFTVGTAISIGIQCLEALEDLHGIGYLHRDVNPANYTIGRAESKELRKVYVLNFGMARKFVNEDRTIKKPRLVARFRGTVKYAPVACHAQRDMCRLDDLESWLYQQVEFTKGALPWRNLKDMNEIGKIKKSCRSDIAKKLFDGCPPEYIHIMRTIDGGRFFDKPNYPQVYRLLKAALKNMNARKYPYDWERWEEDQKRLNEEKKKAYATPKTEITVTNFEAEPLLNDLNQIFHGCSLSLNDLNEVKIEYSTEEEAKKAVLNLNGCFYQGAILNVKFKPKEKSTQPSGLLPSASTKPSNIKTSTATTSYEKDEKVIIAKTPGSKVTNEENGDYKNLTKDKNNKNHHPLVEIVQTPGGLFVKTTPPVKTNNQKASFNHNTYHVNGARDIGTIKQTTFNQNTTNFIVCSLDSLKPLNVQN